MEEEDEVAAELSRVFPETDPEMLLLVVHQAKATGASDKQLLGRCITFMLAQKNTVTRSMKHCAPPPRSTTPQEPLRVQRLVSQLKGIFPGHDGDSLVAVVHDVKQRSPLLSGDELFQSCVDALLSLEQPVPVDHEKPTSSTTHFAAVPSAYSTPIPAPAIPLFTSALATSPTPTPTVTTAQPTQVPLSRGDSKNSSFSDDNEADADLLLGEVLLQQIFGDTVTCAAIRNALEAAHYHAEDAADMLLSCTVDPNGGQQVTTTCKHNDTYKLTSADSDDGMLWLDDAIRVDEHHARQVEEELKTMQLLRDEKDEEYAMLEMVRKFEKEEQTRQDEELARALHLADQAQYKRPPRQLKQLQSPESLPKLGADNDDIISYLLGSSEKKPFITTVESDFANCGSSMPFCVLKNKLRFRTMCRTDFGCEQRQA
eukprot:TRINITY_DN731_c0_g1_i1.p1 TRINITY_DN731_c0_g1~~TRINITY_DN731_c0_g1_i1.p1  ORF type:complete len:428 (-),score=81.28 TRINITY_DN731_c0_g1_i1:1472-2755(-)